MGCTGTKHRRPIGLAKPQQESPAASGYRGDQEKLGSNNDVSTSASPGSAAAIALRDQMRKEAIINRSQSASPASRRTSSVPAVSLKRIQLDQSCRQQGINLSLGTSERSPHQLHSTEASQDAALASNSGADAGLADWSREPPPASATDAQIAQWFRGLCLQQSSSTDEQCNQALSTLRAAESPSYSILDRPPRKVSCDEPTLEVEAPEWHRKLNDADHSIITAVAGMVGLVQQQNRAVPAAVETVSCCNRCGGHLTAFKTTHSGVQCNRCSGDIKKGIEAHCCRSCVYAQCHSCYIEASIRQQDAAEATSPAAPAAIAAQAEGVEEVFDTRPAPVDALSWFSRDVLGSPSSLVGQARTRGTLNIRPQPAGRSFRPSESGPVSIWSPREVLASPTEDIAREQKFRYYEEREEMLFSPTEQEQQYASERIQY